MALFFNTSMRDVGWFALAFTSYIIGITFGQDIKVNVLAKEVTQLRVNWTIGQPVETLKLRYEKKDYPGRTTVELAKNASEFTIEDLIASTKYTVCVIITKTNVVKEVFKCEEFMTIPVMRDDSIVALFAVILVILLIFLTGFCYQKHRKNVLERKLEHDEEALQAHENNIEEDETYHHPKSAIEDDGVNVRL